MSVQTVYFNNPNAITKLQGQVGNIDNQVTTDKIVVVSMSGTNSIFEKNTCRTIEVLDSIIMSTGSSITSNSDILIVEGSISSNSFTGSNIYTNRIFANEMTGGVINQIKTYTNSSDLYSQSVDKVVCITIRTQSGSYYVGSGFFVTGPNMSNYGYILTASHVIGDTDISGIPICNNIWINTSYPTNQIYQINGTTNIVMGYDKISDVSLMRISGTGFNKVFDYKDSRNDLKIGDTINTIGYPGGVDNQSISRGIVRDNKSQLEGGVMESIVTDISIYGGNSGGPLIADNGKVVGIVSYGYTNKEEINGGVASYLFKPIVDYYLSQYSTGTVSYPKGYLGIRYDSVSLPTAVIFGINKVEGYYVISLDGTISPSKFNVNDIITEVNGVRVGVLNNQYPLFTEIQLRPPGTTINVKYRPNGSWNTELTKNVTLSTFNPNNDYLFSDYRREAIKITK